MINLANTLLRRNSWVSALCQLLLICVSLIFSWMLRFDFTLPYRPLLLSSVPVLLGIRLLVIWRFGLLHGWWSYTGLSDALDVLKAVVGGSAIFFATMRFLPLGAAFPRTVYIIEPLLTSGMLIGVRMFSRVLAESVRQDLSARKKVVVIGAGVAGQTVVREMKRANSGFAAVGYVDDDLSKVGRRFEGLAVIGVLESLASVVEHYRPDEALIAVPSATGAQMQRFVEICDTVGIKVRTVPALRDIINSSLDMRQVREVKVEDLLGRDPVQIDLNAVRREIQGRSVVVTGAAGSIGSELCRQIIQYQPRKLICIDQNETGIFYLERELSGLVDNTELVLCVSDIGDIERMQKVFTENTPAAVFHAAAYKHVPVMEVNVQEAVRNNILSLLSLIEVAQNNGCESFVMISSDKAVNPTNVMGVTKRVGELIISCQPQEAMRCSSVRFGNVLGSSGSVVPVLQEQLRSGRSLTITHPEMQRYFMTTREAVSLVLQAFVLGQHGDTLVLDMGNPIRIVDLARTLIRLSGKTEGEVNITFTGLRQGEKLNEELFYAWEEMLATEFPKIRRIRGGIIDREQLTIKLDELRSTLFIDGAFPVKAKLRELVPQYSYLSQPPCNMDESSERQTASIGAAD